MKPFNYGNDEISHKEITYAVASMLIGAGILTLPRFLSSEVKASDAWVSLLAAGGIAVFFAWLIATLAARFPKKTFLDYTAKIVSKPVAVVLTLLFALHMITFAAIETRIVGNISVMYLFDRTPIEAVSLIFLLAVIYAVYGSTVVILRLNMMFLPIIIVIGILLCVFNIGLAEAQNLKPVFTSGLVDYLRGVKASTFSLLGFEILLFYIAFMKSTKRAAKAATLGVSITVFVYLILFLSVIFSFGNEATQNMLYPTIEVAKEVEVPGEFFERFESIFFTVWIMTLFNTTAMAFDVALIALKSVFTKIKRVALISLLSPIIILIGFLPPNLVQLDKFAEWISYSGIVMGMVLPTLIHLVAKIRGIEGDA
jgi:spore germination protein